jgi:hypothetical protein
MKLENIILSEVTQVQMAKSHMFLSYVDDRPNKNVAIFWKTRHTKERSHMTEGE